MLIKTPTKTSLKGSQVTHFSGQPGLEKVGSPVPGCVSVDSVSTAADAWLPSLVSSAPTAPACSLPRVAGRTCRLVKGSRKLQGGGPAPCHPDVSEVRRKGDKEAGVEVRRKQAAQERGQGHAA